MFATPTYPQSAAVPGYPYRLPAVTILPALQNKNVLCILDYDNLRLSVLESQRKFSASLLIQRLTTECKSLEPWAVLGAPAGDFWRIDYLKTRAWSVLAMIWEPAPHGVLRNADFDLVALAAERLAGTAFDATIVGSGDGALVRAVARSARRSNARIEVLTLSVRHSTSCKLLTTVAGDLIDANIFIGDDLVRPMGRESLTAA
jgi:hypothetical protein